MNLDELRQKTASEAVVLNGGDRMSEFEPCPFCGNTDITGATHRPVGSAEFYEVICVECGARIRRLSKRKAVEAWNRRTESR